MPAPSVRRCTSRLSDSLCFPNARHSIRLRQSRRMYHVHRPRQHAVHPIGHDVLDGRPPVSTWQWRPARPHVLQHMTGLPPERRVHQRSSGNLKTRAQCSVLSAETCGALPAEPSPLVSRETSPGPEKRLPCRPLQSGGACCRYRIHRAYPTRSTLSVLAKADASTTLFCGKTSSIPSGTTYSPGGLQQPHCSDVRLVLTCYST